MAKPWNGNETLSVLHAILWSCNHDCCFYSSSYCIRITDGSVEWMSVCLLAKYAKRNEIKWRQRLKCLTTKSHSWKSLSFDFINIDFQSKKTILMLIFAKSQKNVDANSIVTFYSHFSVIWKILLCRPSHISYLAASTVSTNLPTHLKDSTHFFEALCSLAHQ